MKKVTESVSVLYLSTLVQCKTGCPLDIIGRYRLKKSWTATMMLVANEGGGTGNGCSLRLCVSASDPALGSGLDLELAGPNDFRRVAGVFQDVFIPAWPIFSDFTVESWCTVFLAALAEVSKYELHIERVNDEVSFWLRLPHNNRALEVSIPFAKAEPYLELGSLDEFGYSNS